MLTKFWGTRGSLATPGPSTLEFGGNTSCVELRCDDGTLIVLDCGTGARGLGLSLMASGEKPLRGHLFLTHTHWDHIQGFPFFAPLFVPGNEWDVYGPAGAGQDLKAILTAQMEFAYFPIPLDQLGSTIRFHDLTEGTLQVGGARVTAHYLNHPAVTLGYRVEAGGASVVYAVDHEPHSRHQPDGLLAGRIANAGVAAVPDRPVHREDVAHVEFLRGADLLIHDAQYTAAEYLTKIGWGHTSAELAVDMAIEGGVKRLALFHHDPARDDQGLTALEHACRVRAADVGGIGTTLEVFAAAEGQVVTLSERVERAGEVTVLEQAQDVVERVASRRTVLIVDDEPQVVKLLRRALKSEGLHLLSAPSGDAALELAHTVHLDLMLLDWLMPGTDGLDVCRALRADADPKLRDLPVVLLTGRTSSEETEAAFAAGATDYLTKPFGMAHVRARVHEWLLRGESVRSK